MLIVGIRVVLWQHSPARGEDVASIIGGIVNLRHALMIHLHLCFRAYFGITPDVDGAIAAMLPFFHLSQCHRHAIDNIVSGHRSNLATAIDALQHLGVALNGDRGVAAHQGSVTMSFQSLACTEHIALDDGRTRGRPLCVHSLTNAYRYHGVLFHTANLSATIDSAADGAVTNDDRRAAVGMVNAVTFFSHHGFLAGEGVGLTLAAAIHVAGYKDTGSAL